ncbi:hypothetical protein TREMEDRAFT_61772 [Tremella mesenterica DSM 1558]|uniref:uncharacterized protein n=1 Tax=Tremella mesenterica (strain ATCC 24925 / CBS 8224 / DSM 1558 / NBRC 9311 / NRRL Y-6157 / RJB 2259-6 / UBC 559-6) TaxID=578456 RepID=UPI0003F499EB|nr:uncharacterized protein TREMEDRAFT_61772 [Tremella mesenterica DSM 1558]EIW70006.1 hypothetical protein TREMEDRAFT_61772 [Tremella mesenterica DSM 1558]
MDLPTPESLALSASLFTSSIDNWIPSSFGTSSTLPSSSLPELRLGSGGDDDRHGLGHPSINQPKPRISAGLGALNKKFGKRPVPHVSKTKDEIMGKGENESEDEEESRTKMVERRPRSKVVEVLKKRKKKLKNSISITHSSVSKSTVPPSINQIMSTSLPDLSISPLPSIPIFAKVDHIQSHVSTIPEVTPDSSHLEPDAVQLHEHSRIDHMIVNDEDEDREGGAQGVLTDVAFTASGGKTRTQLRRQKRKAAKLAERARLEAASRLGK